MSLALAADLRVSRTRVTYLAADRSVSEVSFHCPLVGRSLSHASVLVGLVSAREILGWFVRQARLLSSDPPARSARRAPRLARASGERPVP